MGEPTRHPFDISEDPVAAFIVQAVNSSAEELIVVHGVLWERELGGMASSFLELFQL
jgi:hypothetical protein